MQDPVPLVCCADCAMTQPATRRGEPMKMNRFAAALLCAAAVLTTPLVRAAEGRPQTGLNGS